MGVRKTNGQIEDMKAEKKEGNELLKGREKK